MSALPVGQKIDNAEQVIVKDNNGGANVIYKIVLTDVLVTEYSVSATGDYNSGCPGAESISLAYGKIQVITYGQDS